MALSYGGFQVPTVSAPAGVMPLKSDGIGKKRVRPSEAYCAPLHTLPKGDCPWKASLLKT